MSGPTNALRPLGTEARYPLARRLAWRLNRFFFPPLSSGSVKILEEPGGTLKFGLLLSVNVAGPVRLVAVETDGLWHALLWPVAGSAIRLPDHADLVARRIHMSVLHRVPPWRITWWMSDGSTPLPAIRHRLLMPWVGRYTYEYPTLLDPAGAPAALLAKLQSAAVAGHFAGKTRGATP